MAKVSFRHGIANSFFGDYGIRKNSHTTGLLRAGIQKLLNNGWVIPLHGNWVSIVKEERVAESLDDALDALAQARRGALSITLEHDVTKDRVFIRWYNSSPQTDVLTVEGSLTIREGKILDATPFSVVKEAESCLEAAFDGQLHDNEIREINKEFLDAQQVQLHELGKQRDKRAHMLDTHNK
ncbi:MAG: hypothetical protein ACTSYO_07265 [Candidatus Ranarchaeia archaeon]